MWFSDCVINLVHEGPFSQNSSKSGKVKNRFSKEIIPYMDTVRSFANKRCSVGVERGCLFLCGQAICWSHVHVSIIQKQPMIGCKGTYRPIQSLNCSHLWQSQLCLMFFIFSFPLHKMMQSRCHMGDL